MRKKVTFKRDCMRIRQYASNLAMVRA
jgi:hypothetical protein